MKVGVLGGTYDPVHRGHLEIAAEAKRSLGLDEVLLIPAGQPRFKGGEAVTPAEHRLAMVRLAVAGRPGYKISGMEIERPGPTYSVDTIAELRRQYRSTDEIYFIMGWDSLEKFPEWREPTRLIGTCIIVAVPRPGCTPPDVAAMEKAVPGIGERLILLENPRVDISATAIRTLAAEGKSIDELVPEPVAEYIKKHKLYIT